MILLPSGQRSAALLLPVRSAWDGGVGEEKPGEHEKVLSATFS